MQTEGGSRIGAALPAVSLAILLLVAPLFPALAAGSPQDPIAGVSPWHNAPAVEWSEAVPIASNSAPGPSPSPSFAPVSTSIGPGWGGFADEFDGLDRSVWNLTGASNSSWSIEAGSSGNRLRFSASACCASPAVAVTTYDVVNFGEDFQLEVAASAAAPSETALVGTADDSAGGGSSSLFDWNRSTGLGSFLNWTFTLNATGTHIYRFVYQAGRVSAYIDGLLSARFQTAGLSGTHRLAMAVTTSSSVDALAYFDRIWYRHQEGALGGPAVPPEPWYNLLADPGPRSLQRGEVLPLNFTVSEEATADMILYANRTQGSHLFVTDLNGRDVAQLTKGTLTHAPMDVRSDGVVLYGEHTSNNVGDLLNMSLDGSGSHIMFDAASANEHYLNGRFGPNGKMVFQYVPNSAGVGGDSFWLADASGANAVQEPVPYTNHRWVYAWMQGTQKWLMTTGTCCSQRDVMIYDTANDTVAFLTGDGSASSIDNICPASSPDNQQIAWVHGSGPRVLYLMNGDGGAKASLGRAGGGICPQWSPAGDLLLVDDTSGNWGYMPPDGSSWTKVKSDGGDFHWYYAGHAARPATTETVMFTLLDPAGAVVNAWFASTNATGRLAANVTLPIGADSGNYSLMAFYSHWRSRTIIEYRGNQAPAWGNITQQLSIEDIPRTVDFLPFLTDGDNPLGALSVDAASPYSTRVSATSWQFVFPNGVTSRVVKVTATDGIASTSRDVLFNVSAVNDPPTFFPPAEYNLTEDELTLLDLSPFMADQDTPTASLLLSSNDSAAAVVGHRVSLRFGEGSTSRNVGFSLFDGEFYANATVRFVFTPLDGPPRLDPLPVLYCRATVECSMDLRPFIHDIDTPLAGLTLHQNSSTLALSNGTLVGTYPAGSRGEGVTLQVSDAESTVTGALDVVVVGDPPAIAPLAVLECVEDVPCSVDIAPSVADLDTPLSELLFTARSSFGRIEGTVFVATYPQPVLGENVTVTVSDGVSASSASLLVHVAPANDPPTLLGEPPTYATIGASYTFAFAAADPDDSGGFSFSLLGGPPGMAVLANGSVQWVPGAPSRGNATFTVRVSDPHGAFDERTFTVEVTGTAPTVTGVAPLNASNHLPYVGQILAAAAAGGPLRYELVGNAPAGLRVNATTGAIDWVPDYPFLPAGLNITEGITVRAIDGPNASPTFSALLRVTEPPNRLPSWGAVSDPRGEIGTSLTLNLSGLALDPDAADQGRLQFRLVGASSPAVIAELQGDRLTLRFHEGGNSTITVGVVDRSRSAVLMSIDATTEQPLPVAVSPAGAPFGALLGLAAAFAAVGVGLWLRSREPVEEEQTANVATCHQCAAPTSPDARFCRECGAPQPAGDGTQIYH